MKFKETMETENNKSSIDLTREQPIQYQNNEYNTYGNIEDAKSMSRSRYYSLGKVKNRDSSYPKLINLSLKPSKLHPMYKSNEEAKDEEVKRTHWYKRKDKISNASLNRNKHLKSENRNRPMTSYSRNFQKLYKKCISVNGRYDSNIQKSNYFDDPEYWIHRGTQMSNINNIDNAIKSYRCGFYSK